MFKQMRERGLKCEHHSHVTVLGTRKENIIYCFLVCCSRVAACDVVKTLDESQPKLYSGSLPT